MAASILRLGRLGSFKCLQLESWGILRSHSAVLFCSKSGEPEKPVKKTKASSKTDAPNERAALLAYKTTVAFPIRLSEPGFFSAQSVGEAESVVSSTAAEKIIATEVPSTAAREPALAEQEAAGPAAPASLVSSEPGDTAAELSSSSSSESDSDSDSDTEDEKAHVKTETSTSQPVVKEPTVKEEAHIYEVTEVMKDTNEAQREPETAPASGSEAVQDSTAPSEAAKDAPDMTNPEDAAPETDAPPASPPAQGQSPEKGQTDTCIKTTDSVSAEEDGKSGHEETPEHDPVDNVLGPREAPAPAVDTLMEDSPVEAAPEPAQGVTEPVGTEAFCEASAEVAAEVTNHAESAEELVDAAPVIPEAKHDPVDNVLDPGEAHAPAVETLMVDSPVEAAPEPVGTEAFCEATTEVASHAESAEELMDAAPVIPEAGGEDLQTEAPVDQSEETVVMTPPEPEEPFDNSTYQNYQHHSYNPYTFADMDVEMAKFRLAQPSSGRPSPRH
ncbi:fibrous sheath CABYR-binding protein isoform X2 [Parambassis ranga]|uniref:Fibrous sheath CABYR-binding protein isoform X2 n=1 Tax=Parambassis ranga TaxID=210632 RepID=A0A6P7HAQ6_9TELE|nr:NADH dehydrogenase [ubiquinone] flavoprotein 3, mitochondrial isoform X2 [Parambassis ranga]